jgi:hypothetical protein
LTKKNKEESLWPPAFWNSGSIDEQVCPSSSHFIRKPQDNKSDRPLAKMTDKPGQREYASLNKKMN